MASIPAARKIGDAPMNPIGFGAMGMAHGFPSYGAPPSDEERFKLLDAVYDSGCRHWDTADAYGDSEEFIGRWFARTGKRDEIFIATKCAVNAAGPPRGDAAYVKQQCNASLKRLGVQRIDLFYLHRIDTRTPIELTIRAMVDLINEGKITYIGLSECGVSDLRRAHAVHPINALQMDYSPLWLNIERSGILAATKELGITLVAYSPLGKGLITGQYKSPDDFEPGDYRLGIPRFSKDNFPRILAAVDKIRDVAKAHNATPGQVALAWILSQSDNIVVIPGTKKVKYLKENMGALDVKLTVEEIQAVREICEESDRVLDGDRMPAHTRPFVLVESPPLVE
ncbi:Aldo/keto reductase [Cylindrobasidium torrendii FP15055 ss-10]|uniref:Aldo/keto reductase n=1 Tax=Cylindrobasidium torrendii FP15055 ss-10 TaxID=1314674 RepID=A0A0D7BSD5_9AGAR|nr:Aldo/keto reductase [Cylindrobasidium torrendii FP15055 ss-10]